MKGNGKDIILTPQEMKESDRFNENITTNQKRFEKSLIDEDNTLFKQIISLKEGETVTLKKDPKNNFTDYWDRDIKRHSGTIFDADPDQTLSTGAIKLRSTGTIQATRRGDEISIHGDIDNEINDIYDFNDDTLIDKAIFDVYRKLEKEGHAQIFKIKGNRPRQLKGTITIKNGKIKNSTFHWHDKK